MTVVVAFENNNQSFLLADTMITSFAPRSDGVLTVPISNRKIKGDEALDYWGTSFISRYLRKITLINEQLAVAFAGNVLIGQSMIREIKFRLSDYNTTIPDTINIIASVIGEYSEREKNDVAIVGLILSIEGFSCGINAFAMGVERDGFVTDLLASPLILAGSGSGVMLENISSVVAVKEMIEISTDRHLASTSFPLGVALISVAMQHYREIIRDGSLECAFGGPFELVHVGSNGGRPFFQLLPEVSFSYWYVQKQGEDGFGFGLTGYIIFQKYVDSVLVSATLRMNTVSVDNSMQVGILSPEEAVVTSISTDLTENISDEVKSFLSKPIFEPKTNVLMFVDQTNLGKYHSAISFNDEYFEIHQTLDGFWMKFDPRLLDVLRDWYN